MLRVGERGRQRNVLALVDLILPESQAAGVGGAVQEVKVVLPHEELVVETVLMNRIWTVNRFVTVDGDGDCGRRAQRTSYRLAQSDVEVLLAFAVGVIDNQDRNCLGSFTGGEPQGAEPGDIVTALE